MNIKVLPADMSEGIERFLAHMCKSEADRDKQDSIAHTLALYRSKYDVEIKRHLAHIWDHRRSSVAWIVLADDAVMIAKPHTDALCRCSDCLKPRAHFKRGDILKSATWKAPAKNFARGNVLTDASFPRWHWNGWI